MSHVPGRWGEGEVIGRTLHARPNDEWRITNDERSAHLSFDIRASSLTVSAFVILSGANQIIARGIYPCFRKRLCQRRRAGELEEQRSDGIGDVELSVIVRVHAVATYWERSAAEEGVAQILVPYGMETISSPLLKCPKPKNQLSCRITRRRSARRC